MINEGALQIKLRELSESLEQNKTAIDSIRVSLESTKNLINSSAKQTSERLTKTDELVKSLDSKTLKKEIKIYLAETTKKESEKLIDNFEIKIENNISELEERLSTLLSNVKEELSKEINEKISFMTEPVYEITFKLIKDLVIKKNNLNVEPYIFPNKGKQGSDNSLCIFDFSLDKPEMVVGNKATKIFKKFKVKAISDPNCKKGTIKSLEDVGDSK